MIKNLLVFGHGTLAIRSTNIPAELQFIEIDEDEIGADFIDQSKIRQVVPFPMTYPRYLKIKQGIEDVQAHKKSVFMVGGMYFDFSTWHADSAASLLAHAEHAVSPMYSCSVV